MRLSRFRGVIGLRGALRLGEGRGCNPPQAYGKGFTLIELMVTLSVAGILLAIAVPSFKEFIDSNRISAGVYGYLRALNLARSEAIKSNVRVTLCVSANEGKTCTSGGWELGFLVYRDAFPEEEKELDLRDVDNDDHKDFVLSEGAPLAHQVTLRGSNADIANTITFTSSGRATDFESGFREFVICDDRVKSFANDKKKSRIIILGHIGKAYIWDWKNGDKGITVTTCTPT